MIQRRHEIAAQFGDTAWIPHPRFNAVQTYSFLHKTPFPLPATLTAPRLQIELIDFDYLHRDDIGHQEKQLFLRFQYPSYSLWYQIEGSGILQNVTRNNFGTARPGLFGVMDRSERYTYLHQKGAFDCFLLRFNLFPSYQNKCYWNSAIEGKVVLDEAARLSVENRIFTFLNTLSHHPPQHTLLSVCTLIEIIQLLFDSRLLTIEESQFPKNKQKSLVEKAKNHIKQHFATLHHQRALEKVCGVDINYLNILFKQSEQMTIYAYLTRIRMEHAQYLLEEHKRSISEIAATVGYPTPNSFSRMFRKCFSMTPSEYRTHSRIDN
jgi:AraC-like DNA-binding protein